MLRSRIKAFSHLLELIAQVLLKGRTHVVAIARPSHVPAVVRDVLTSVADTDVLFNATSIPVFTVNETSTVDTAVAAILSAGSPPSHLVLVTFAAEPVEVANDSDIAPMMSDGQEVDNATASTDLELLASSDVSVYTPELSSPSSYCLHLLAMLFSLLVLLAERIGVKASMVLSHGFSSRHLVTAFSRLRVLVGLLMIDRVLFAHRREALWLITQCKSRIQLLAFMAMCEARACYKMLFAVASHILSLLPYMVLDKPTMRRLIKLVKAIRLIMMELRVRSFTRDLPSSDSTTNSTLTDRISTIDLDDDIIAPPLTEISAAPLMMRWSHFGRAPLMYSSVEDRPASLTVPLVRLKKESEVDCHGHFDMTTLSELYACRSTHFSHFGSMNKVPILDTLAWTSLDIEIDVPDHDSSPRKRLSHFGSNIEPYSVEEGGSPAPVRHLELNDPAFVFSFLPGSYPEDSLDSCSAGDYYSGLRFFNILFCDIWNELATHLWLIVDSRTADTPICSGSEEHVVGPDVVSVTLVFAPAPESPRPSGFFETEKPDDHVLPRQRSPKPIMPASPDVFSGETSTLGGHSTGNESEGKPSSISLGVHPGPRTFIFLERYHRPPDASTLDTPTKWTSSVCNGSPVRRRWAGRRRKDGLEEDEDSEDFSVPPLSIWDYPYHPLTPRSESAR